MAGVLQMEKAFDPCDHFMAGRTRRFVKVDQPEPYVLINCSFVGRTAERGISFLIYPREYLLRSIPWSLLRHCFPASTGRGWLIKCGKDSNAGFSRITRDMRLGCYANLFDGDMLFEIAGLL